MSRNALLTGVPTPLSRSIAFLTDDYASEGAGFWWELVEMNRKLMLTGWVDHSGSNPRPYCTSGCAAGSHTRSAAHQRRIPCAAPLREAAAASGGRRADGAEIERDLLGVRLWRWSGWGLPVLHLLRPCHACRAARRSRPQAVPDWQRAQFAARR
eukprot:5916967-Prymnesium_polylepis.2